MAIGCGFLDPGGPNPNWGKIPASTRDGEGNLIPSQDKDDFIPIPPLFLLTKLMFEGAIWLYAVLNYYQPYI